MKIASRISRRLLACDVEDTSAQMSQSSKVHVRQFANGAILSLSLLIACSGRIEAQSQAGNAALNRLAWSTDSTGPRRFVSVHGRRSAIFGYSRGNSEDGLEVWAYPVQILRSYSVAFRQQGATTGIEGETVLRRILYSPEAVTRIYAGPDFIVRERLFVPLDEPGAIIRYEVESARPLDIEIRFIPVLDLMWPSSIGGQDAVWNSSASSYLLSELTHRFTASVGSPNIVAHDETPNTGQQVGRAPGLAFTLRAGGDKTANVIIAGSDQHQDASVIAKQLFADAASIEKAAVDHYSNLLSQTLQIQTPDADANRALAWSEIALDQAWVCNPDLGCGLVAGYGPSRKARRPQYDWFFAGDGMVAIHALLAAGQYERARQELEFILKYQDQKSGMIWHELSQSAGLLDWSKYPYMFVHVDLTFDFLNIVGDYYSAAGDRDFVKAHWPSIQSAYDYCRSLLDPKDLLPRIPADKEGGREQDALSDELALSASWAAAAQAFADLAAATGHNAAAGGATAASQQASQAIARRYWDESQNSWITGYTRSGSPLVDRGIGPSSVRGKPLFSETQRNSLLDQLATSDFQGDWGTRGRAASADGYDPNSYASGSVWATGSSGTAAAFWADHRPATALPIWNALVPWSSLDSLGHMHEALAGDYYHEEVESVPEQTWSSALFFTAAVNGLLGLQVDGVKNRVTFAPHLPSNWNAITLRNVHVGASEISIHMVQSAREVRLQMQNEGAPVEIVFDPEIPLGAKLTSARLGNRSIAATLERHPQDTHAKVEFSLPHGSMLLTIDYAGGIAILTDPPRLMIGEPSKAIKITGVNLKGRVYTVDFDHLPSTANRFELRTPWTIEDVRGATFEATSPDSYRFTVSAPIQEKEPRAYRRGTVTVTFAHGRLD
jgi:glycogen debranching enzyme